MKKISVIFVLLLALASLNGCGKTPPAPEPEKSAWEFTVGAKVFTIEGLKEMKSVTLDLEMKGEVSSYTGVPLFELLAEAGVEDFQTLVLEAEDGYTGQVTREEALHKNSILCYALNGGELNKEKHAPLMFASELASTQVWVGKLKHVRVGE
jgi:hypothetical protein